MKEKRGNLIKMKTETKEKEKESKVKKKVCRRKHMSLVESTRERK